MAGSSFSLTYDPWLVAISFLIAAGAAYTALDMAERITTSHGRTRRWWLWGGAATMGLGVWSMHFTGMMALRLPPGLSQTYGIGLTAVSMLVAMLASAAALFLTSRPTLTKPTLLAGGVAMGLGIAAMHYTGMAAMRVPCVTAYDPVFFAASLVIAISASIAALYLTFQLKWETVERWSWRKLSSAVVMGVAICGMHYTGLAAAHFIPFCGQAAAGANSLRVNDLGAGAIALGTLIVLAVALTGSHSRRLKWQQDVMKDRFLGILSHELRTPINAITGFASILEDGLAGPLTPQQQQYITRILEGSDRLLHLVDDLLDMSRIQAGKFSVTLAPMALGPVLEQTLASFAPAAEAKRIRLVAELEDGLPCVEGDAPRVGQVLANLVANALKFTPEGGAVTVKAARHAEGCVRVEVDDSGPGIAPRDLPRLFQPFSQLDMSTTRQAGGVGLGLSIAKALIEAHGGAIGAESHPEGGARFWFTLRITPSAL